MIFLPLIKWTIRKIYIRIFCFLIEYVHSGKVILHSTRSLAMLRCKLGWKIIFHIKRASYTWQGLTSILRMWKENSSTCNWGAALGGEVLLVLSGYSCCLSDFKKYRKQRREWPNVQPCLHGGGYHMWFVLNYLNKYTPGRLIYLHQSIGKKFNTKTAKKRIYS